MLNTLQGGKCALTLTDQYAMVVADYRYHLQAGLGMEVFPFSQLVSWHRITWNSQMKGVQTPVESKDPLFCHLIGDVSCHWSRGL